MEIRPLNQHLQQTAITELNEDPNRIKEDIQHIKDWLKKQPHLKAREDDQWILSFLRGCKYSLEKTKQKLDSFYTFRTAAPEFFHNRIPDNPFMETLLKTRAGCILPIAEDIPGPTIFLFKATDYDSSMFKGPDLIKMSYLSIDILLHESDRTVIEGISSIVDAIGMTFSHAVQFTPLLIQKSLRIFFDGYPIRVRSVHFVNLPANFIPLFNLVKKCTLEKVRQRMFLHETVDTLKDHFPARSLPNEYGGTAGSIDEIADKYCEKMKSYSKWLKDDEQYLSQEHLRPGKPKTSDELFNMAGSFRKLNVD